MKISREVKTGLLAVVAIALFVFGYNFMKGHNIFDSSKEVYAVYEDVEGLSVSSDVMINGLKIGKVSDIRFMDRAGNILVTMRIDSDFAFSKKSIAQIYSDGLIGGKIMKVLPDYTGESIQSGDTLIAAKEEGVLAQVVSRLVPLREKFENAMGGIDSLVGSLNNVLDEDGQNNLKKSLADLSVTMENLKGSSEQINGLLSRNATKFDQTIDNFDKTASNFNSLSDSLAQIEVKPLVEKVNGVLSDLDEIASNLKNGKGTAGKLLNDDNVYENLDNASRQMEELIQDIKLNPKRYINLKFSLFGGKNKHEAYRKPENRLE